MASTTIFNSISMANGCLTSHPALITTKPSYPFIPLSSKPSIKLHLSSHSLPSWVSIQKKHSSTIVTLVAQTSDWASQDNVVEVEEPQEGINLEIEDKGELTTEATGSDFEGEASEEVGTEESGAEEESYPEPPEEAKLFVGNLPYDIDSEKLAQLFDGAGIVEIAEVIYNRETDQSRGFGFITMSTVEEAEKAVEMFNRYDINGRLLTVNKAAPRGSRAPREFQSSLRIYVGNLPWQVDDARLEQVFSEHGKVVDARVVFDRESGRSRGFGFVTMSSQTELDDAIAALDGQSLDGRAIRVNVAEERPRRNSF